ncbi:MAG: DUF1192 domain-containing protein [Proteobacteria bacterium]|nr:DUF1192 domain-containing protein [Pseudomonadota bacterium]
MDIEELEPRKKKPEPKNLEAMGVEELEAYRAELEAELARVKTEIEGKKSYLAGAGAFFKS